MYTINCRECGVCITAELKGKEIRKLQTHLKLIHKMDAYCYVKKHYCNGKHPLCACGCGKEVEFKKFKFLKYYKDHKNCLKWTNEQKEKYKEKCSVRGEEWNYLRSGLSEDKLKEWFELYKKSDYPYSEISKISGYDFRTIVKYWKWLKISNQNEISRYSKLHKSVWANVGIKNGSYERIDDDFLLEIYQYLKTNKNKLTIGRLKHILNVKQTKLVLYKRLVEKFGKDEIDSCLKSGLSSRPELEFYYVLQYFFGEKNIKKQFKIERKLYDFLLFEKLIIEYDGEYWHKRKIKEDKEKDDLALSRGYVIFRVKECDSHKIDTLTKIKEITDEIQISRN